MGDSHTYNFTEIDEIKRAIAENKYNYKPDIAFSSSLNIEYILNILREYAPQGYRFFFDTKMIYKWFDDIDKNDDKYPTYYKDLVDIYKNLTQERFFLWHSKKWGSISDFVNSNEISESPIIIITDNDHLNKIQENEKLELRSRNIYKINITNFYNLTSFLSRQSAFNLRLRVDNDCFHNEIIESNIWEDLDTLWIKFFDQPISCSKKISILDRYILKNIKYGDSDKDNRPHPLNNGEWYETISLGFLKEFF